MSKTAAEPRAEFEPDEKFSDAEIGETLKVPSRRVRDWVTDGLIDLDGVTVLPKGVRIAGWALNAFLADLKRRRLGV